MGISDEQYRNTAKALFHNEGDLEVDENAAVSRGDDPGAYVQVWVWVSNADVRINKKYGC